LIGAKDKDVTFRSGTSPHMHKLYNQIFICEGKLFVYFVLSHGDLPNHGASHYVLDMIGKPLISMGALRWFPNVKNYNARIINY
jgi:hypothetical protein